MRIAFGLTLISAATVVALCLTPAHGAANSSGELGAGGTVKGDIGKSGTEVDVIGVNLVQGSKLSVRWSAGFSANVGFFDPDGVPVALGLDATKTSTVTGFEVPRTGRFEFRVSATGAGTQGTYLLVVKPSWDKTVVLDGTASATFDVPMPAGSSLRGKVQAAAGSANAAIPSLQAPDATELLAAPLGGTKTVVALPRTLCGAEGVYRLGASATGAFRATLKRTTQKIVLTKLSLANGLDTVSFANDGIDSYFRNRCTSCHSWAGSYAGVRAYARNAYDRMRSGNMPQGGPRADAATLALLDQWIKTGYGR